ncbi:hypothetical protein LCGC14_1930800 [marine sediment metagenome]|uniref:Uncharacterized protein n=1 Tax=marine sediment metagenome TaxID=412755 RepID=A0A0F9FN36_9ZZZZ
MADNPAILVENFYNRTQFPDHVISANEEGTNNPARWVGNGRRSVLNFWASTTANAVATLDVDCAIARTPTAFVIDRGHNLDGIAIKLQGDSAANFATATDVLDLTIPSSASTDADFDLSGSANGVYTDEGAWLVRFTGQSFRYWRLRVAAMGAGLTPQVVNLWLGATWEPGEFERPLLDENNEVVTQATESEFGWQGYTQRVRRRGGEFGLKLTLASLEAAALTATDLMALHPFWLIHDADKTERAVLAMRETSRQGLNKARDWFHRSGRISWVELQPKVV